MNYDSCQSLTFPSLPACHSLPSSPSLHSFLCSPLFPAPYHLLPVTERAFGAPCRHSHVAAADKRMWPWMAAARRATREHFKGFSTAGWESPRPAHLWLQKQALCADRKKVRARTREISYTAANSMYSWLRIPLWSLPHGREQPVIEAPLLRYRKWCVHGEDGESHKCLYSKTELMKFHFRDFFL